VQGDRIDWSSPWLAPLAPWRARAEVADWPLALSQCARSQGLVNAAGRPIEFVAADDAAGAPYEAHIFATGRVPSRANRHDLFNALVWLAYPRAKAALNGRQAAVIAREGIGAQRGPVRDAATLIDESGIMLATDDDDVLVALARHDWQWLFVRERQRWGGRIAVRVFGHALLERLSTPFKAITAAVIPVAHPGATEELDRAAADFIEHADLAPRRLPHLPVLGIPGWWPENEAPSFYLDRTVFRPPRDGGSGADDSARSRRTANH